MFCLTPMTKAEIYAMIYPAISEIEKRGKLK